MSRINNNQIMEQLTAMNTMMQSIIEEQKNQRADISALQKAVSVEKTSSKKTESSKKQSAPTKTSKKSSKKSAPKTSTKSSTKVDTLAQFEPKKDADGNYNYKSWKTCRAKYVASVTGKKDSWVAYDEFCKIAEPFDARFTYIKKSDR